MPPSTRPPRWPRRWLLWIAMGLVLRLVLIYIPRTVDWDTWDYLELGRNLLHHGTYGMGSGANLHPSLFRLPAYPILLALFDSIFGSLANSGWMVALYLFQAVADIAAGLLIAAFARRFLSERAGEITLALAMLCPFTAAEAGTAMTECLSIFAVSLGIYAAGRAIAAEQSGARDIRAMLLAASASALAMLLRPDGAILPAALAIGIFCYTLRTRSQNHGRNLRRALAATAVFSLLALLPTAVWAARNWIDFRVFQPLAPRYIADPGERDNAGIHRWLRTWSIEYVSTANVWWHVGEATIDPANLPTRAFDSPAQREQTLALIADYNRVLSTSAAFDARFAALAAERVQAHPIRYYVWLPILRIGDQVFRPRTDEFSLEPNWWAWSTRPGQTTAAILLGLLNLAFVAAAAWGFLCRRVPFAWMLGAYLLFRFALLATLEAPEPRYSIQCFPIFILAAAAALSVRFSDTAANVTPPWDDQNSPAVRKSSSD